jgi:hypothetical protein
MDSDSGPELDGSSSTSHSDQSDTDANPDISRPVPVYSSSNAADNKDVSEADSLVALRSSWKFAAVIQFCRLWSSTLRLRAFSADQLERVLLEPEAYRSWIAELVHKLLRPDPSLPYVEKDSERWERQLLLRVTKRWWDSFAKNPMRNNTFFSITPMMRVRAPPHTSLHLLPRCHPPLQLNLVQTSALHYGSIVPHQAHACRAPGSAQSTVPVAALAASKKYRDNGTASSQQHPICKCVQQQLWRAVLGSNVLVDRQGQLQQHLGVATHLPAAAATGAKPYMWGHTRPATYRFLPHKCVLQACLYMAHARAHVVQHQQ